jgi:hypothetical protein
MASGGKEHRMVFDIRGRRKVAVKVVYGVLAVLMGLSLFLVVGPLNIGEIFGSGSGSANASKPFEEQAERLEAKLKREPENSDLLLALTRAQVNAANANVEITSAGERVMSTEAFQQYQEASATWSDYLEATKEPSASLAQVVAPMLLNLAEVSTGNQIVPNIHAATAAQEIVAKQRPTVNSLSTLAIYQNFSFRYKDAEKTAAEAEKLVHGKAEKEELEKQLASSKQNARNFQKALIKSEKQAKATGQSKAALENPLQGGLGGSSSLGE